MSRNIPARSVLAAVLAAVVAVALLMVLILQGKHAEEKAGPEAVRVPAGFSTIDPDDIFSTVVDAQEDAGSWKVSTVAEVQGQTQPTSVVEVEEQGDARVFRIQMPTNTGVVEGLWDGAKFYEKNPQGTGAEQWFSYPEGLFDPAAIAQLSNDVGALEENFKTVEAKVVGTEVITDLEGDEVQTVKYRIILEPTAQNAAQDVDPSAQRIQVQLWLDKENRPVQTQGVAASSGSQTTAYYSDYGQSFDINAPSPDQVTERDPQAQPAS